MGLTGVAPGSRLRVGLVVPSTKGGGAEFVAMQWATFLRGQGHDVSVVTTHDPEDRPADVPVVRLAAPSFLNRALKLRRHARDERYDVLVGLMPHWNLLVLLSTLAWSGRPATVVSGRNVEAPLRRVHGLAYRAELALCRILYPRADAYVAISHPVAAEALGRYGLDPDRVWVVPNPATGKSPSSRPRRVGGTSRTVTLTVPARLVRQKRPELAVETAAALRHHGIEASVEFFGRGPEQASVQEAADRLGVEVRFLGWVDSWFEQAADDAVVLLPSLAEGFGNVLVEAAAAGIPSVACSRALGVADAVVPHLTGVLTMTEEPADLAEGVLAAMPLDPRSATGWLGRFAPQESGERLLRVLLAVSTPSSRTQATKAAPEAQREPAASPV